MARYIVRNTRTGAYFGDPDPASKSAFKAVSIDECPNFRPRIEHVVANNRLVQIVTPSMRAAKMSADAARYIIDGKPHLAMEVAS